MMTWTMVWEVHTPDSPNRRQIGPQRLSVKQLQTLRFCHNLKPETASHHVAVSSVSEMEWNLIRWSFGPGMEPRRYSTSGSSRRERANRYQTRVANCIGTVSTGVLCAFWQLFLWAMLQISPCFNQFSGLQIFFKWKNQPIVTPTVWECLLWTILRFDEVHIHNVISPEESHDVWKWICVRTFKKDH